MQSLIQGNSPFNLVECRFNFLETSDAMSESEHVCVVSVTKHKVNKTVNTPN